MAFCVAGMQGCQAHREDAHGFVSSDIGSLCDNLSIKNFMI